MKSLFRAFIRGVAFAFGAVLVIGSVVAVRATTISYITTPQAAADIVANLNYLISQINNNTPGGTGTPMAAYISLDGSTSQIKLQQSVAWTTTTSSCGSVSNSTGCFGFENSAGVLHWVPAK